MEQRQHKRKSFVKPIDYSVYVVDFRGIKKLALKGTSIDISDKGMGMHTEYSLEPGHALMFSSEIVGYKVGIVKWSEEHEDNNAFRVGIKFI